jgi:hypothetical protein
MHQRTRPRSSILLTAAAAVAMWALPGVASAQAVFAALPGGGLFDPGPFSIPGTRYQVWYAPDVFAAAAINRLFRANQLIIPAGPSGGEAPVTINIAVRMANAPAVGASPFFDQNYASPPVTVFEQGDIFVPLFPLSPITIPFDNEFVWDGESGVIVEFQYFSNSLGGVTNLATGRQLVGVGNATILSASTVGAASATRFSPGQGMAMFLQGNRGVTVPFGDTCRNAHFSEPRAVAVGGPPLVGNATFALECQQTSPQLPCLLMTGLSRSNAFTLGGPLLPLDTAAFGFTGGCDLLVDPFYRFPILATGGGPGTSTAIAPLPIPQNPGLAGLNLFAQWFVFDVQAPLGPLATTNGVWIDIGQ